jgi:hypothetical protein
MADFDFIQPRYALLEVWRAVARHSYRDGRWQWHEDGGPHAISDAEQLLCLLHPATTSPPLRLEIPNSIPRDVRDALRPLGDSVRIPQVLVEGIEGFLDRHTLEDGTPEFGAGDYYTVLDGTGELSADQLELDSVVSYAASINLCLAALGFLSQYKRGVRQQWADRVDGLLVRVGERLTAALTGLLRSFTMNPVSLDSDEGRELLRMLNQESRPERSVIAEFNTQMQLVRGRLPEARLGVTRAEELENANLLFEIGWTWGIAEDARTITLEGENADPKAGRGAGEDGVSASPVYASAEREGVALSKPYLYFTLVALEAIELLSAERTRVLGLLDAQQERLATALSIRRDLTQIYWSRLARFGSGPWPLEDLPWRTVDGVESDYLTLLVCAVLLQDLNRREANEDDLRRLQPLLTELANRSRITRRALQDDQALGIHFPGLRVTLEGSEKLGPTLAWSLVDFAPLLLRRVAQAASLTSDSRRRDELLGLASDVWRHVSRRMFADGEFEGLWDDPTRIFDRLDQQAARPSWAMSYRVVEAMVGIWGSQSNRATRNQGLGEMAAAMISETEYKVNQELSFTVALPTPLQDTLRELREAVSRAKTLSDSQPATAMSLCVPILQELDQISQSRADAKRSEGATDAGLLGLG